MSSIIEKLTNGVSNMGSSFGKTLDRVDNIENPTLRKMARCGLDLVVVALGVALIAFMYTSFSGNLLDGTFAVHPLDFHALADPGMGTIMGLAIGCAGVGIGTAWLLEDLVSPKYHRTVRKIMAFILPLALGAGAACLIACHFDRYGAVAGSMNNYYTAGLILAPFSVVAAGSAIKRYRRKELHIEPGPPPPIPTKTKRKQNLPPNAQL
jgi:hypothetical protein